MKSRVFDGLDFFEAPWAIFRVLGAVGPRAAATPVALPLEVDGSRLRSSRRTGTSLGGLLRFNGKRHVEKKPKKKVHEDLFNIGFDAFENDGLDRKVAFPPTRCKLKLMNKA